MFTLNCLLIARHTTHIYLSEYIILYVFIFMYLVCAARGLAKFRGYDTIDNAPEGVLIYFKHF